MSDAEPLPDATRRELLAMLGAGAAITLGIGACSGSCRRGRRAGGEASNAAQIAAVLPAYHPIKLLEPEVPGEGPIPDGFLSYPKTKFARVIKEKPGLRGPQIRSMTPWWGPVAPGLGRNAYLAAINAELGVEMNPIIQDGNTYGDKLSAVLGARDVPDLLCAPSWEVDKIPRFSQAVKALFADLTEHLKGENVSTYPMLATLPTASWQHSVWGGRLAAIPFPTDGPFPWGMFYRKDLTDAAGLEPPATIDELYRFGKKATDPSRGVWAFGDTFEMIQMYFKCPGSKGGWGRKPGGGLEFKYETKQYRQAVEFTARLYKEGFVHPDMVASSGADAKQLFKSGKILMQRDGMGAWRGMQSEQVKIKPDFDMQPLPVFSAVGGDPLVWGSNNPVFFTFLKKGLGEKRTRELLRVLDWCAAPFGSFEYELNLYGVEGQHFTRAADNSPIPTELGRKEIVNQFEFISGRAPVLVGTDDVPHFVRDLIAYSKATAKYMERDLFEGIKLEFPASYSSVIVSTEDKIRDVVRGRRPLSDLDEIVEEWRRTGGDDGRAFFEKALSDNGR